MTVQRNSEPARLAVQDTRQYSSPNISVGNNQPDMVRSVGDSTWRANLVNNLVGLTTQVAKIQFDNDTTDAYLKGAAQAGTDKLEADLQADPLTKDYATAGFRDTMGKLKQSEQDGELAKDMVWLRESPPEKMAEYLNKQRGELLPVLNGMSGQARSTMIPTMALRDQAAIAKHGAEYQAHVFKMEGLRLTTPIVQGLNELSNIREQRLPGEVYQQQERKVIGEAVAMWTDGRIPRSQKSALTQELLEYSLTNQHLGLYQALRDAKVPDSVDEHGNWFSSGKPTSILERMDLPTQEKMAGAYLKAKEATAAVANQDFMDRMSIEHAAIKSGTSVLNFDQWKNFLDSATSMKLIKQNQRDDMIQDFYKNQASNQNSLLAGQAFMFNDSDKVFSFGKDMGAAKKDADKILAKLPLPDQVKSLSRAVDLGNVEAAGMIGERVGPAVMQLSVTDGKMSPEHEATLATVHGVLDKYQGNHATVAQIYAGMPEQVADRLRMLREQHADGKTGAVSLSNVLLIEKAAAGKTPQEKAVLAAETIKDDEKYVQSIGNAGWWQRAWWSASSVFSRENGIRDSMEQNGVLPDFITKGTALAETPTDIQVRDLSRLNVQTALREELRRQSLKGTLFSSEERTQAAMAEVMKRSLQTAQGAIVLPARETPHKYFGFTEVGDNATPVGMIEQAISKRFKPTSEGGRVDLRADRDGLHWQEYDRNGTTVPGQDGILPPTVIRDEVKQLQNKALQPIREQVGEGVKHTDNGVTLQYNGVNTAGVPPKDMLQFRKDLVSFEGIRRVAYDDLSGKVHDSGPRKGQKVQTVGVGVSTTNENFPVLDAHGVASDAAIADSFKAASNNAARIALTMQDKTGIKNSASFLLFGQFAYQGQGNFTQFANALSSRDQDAALAALKATTAYGYAKGARRKRYEQLTIEALKG